MNQDIKEISKLFQRYRTYYIICDFILFFLISYLLSYYFNFRSMFSGFMEFYIIDAVSLDKIIVTALAVLISALVVIVLYKLKAPISAVKQIESRYEWMRERLQTACDSRSEDNVVASDLKMQVGNRLKQVDTGSFLDRKYIAQRLLLSAVVAVTLMGLVYSHTQSGFTPNDIPRFIDQIGGNLTQQIASQDSGKDNGTDEEIFGETAVASIEGENVEVFIVPGFGTSYTIRHAGENDNVQFVPSMTYPVDVISSAAADESYQALQQLPPPERELIRDYAVRRSKL